MPATRILLIAALFSLTQADGPAQEQLNKTCLKSSGAKPEQIARIRTGTFSDDSEVKKYFGCMMRGVGVINEAGKLQVDVLRSRVPKDMKKDEAMKIFLSCKDKKGATGDETAYLLYKCFWEASPKHLGLDGQ